MVSRLIVVLLFSSHLSSTLSMPDSFDKIFPSKPPKTLELGPNRTIVLDKYLNHTELETLLQHLETEHKDIMRIEPIGTSSLDCKPIWAVEITKNVQMERQLLKPMFKFVANVHGDETVGYALMVSLIQYLVYMYKNKDKRVEKILEEIDVWIIPSLNPDGLSQAKEGQCTTLEGGLGRDNGYGKDIGTVISGELKGEYELRREIYSMVEFLLDEDHPFVLSGNLEGGDIVASSPPIMGTILETYPPGKFIPQNLRPDNSVFMQLASEYAMRNRMMSQREPCNIEYMNGFTNKWKTTKTYMNKKIMQDFNYIETNCFELTLELSCCKYPYSKDLPYYWQANLDAMLNLIESTRRGVYGFVLNKHKEAIQDAVIVVLGNNKSIRVTKNGEYWRLLGPGSNFYSISVIAPGYRTKTIQRLVTKNETYVRLDFVLRRNCFTFKNDKYSSYYNNFKRSLKLAPLPYA